MLETSTEPQKSIFRVTSESGFRVILLECDNSTKGIIIRWLIQQHIDTSSCVNMPESFHRTFGSFDGSNPKSLHEPN